MAINLKPRSKYDKWTGSFLREENVRYGEHESAHVDPTDESDEEPAQAPRVQDAPRRQARLERLSSRPAQRKEASADWSCDEDEPDDAREFLQGQRFDEERHAASAFRKSQERVW